jgi:hypothetical protein
MQNKELPETYMGYSTKDLLRTWEELQKPGGTKASEEQIVAMDMFLKEYKLGVFGMQKKEG